MKPFFLGMFTALLLIVIGSFGYLRLGLVEVRGDIPASRFETYLMRATVHASVRRNAPEVSNPVPPSEENLIAGGKQYLGECAGCHGIPGKQQKYPSGLYPPVPQLPIAGTEYTEAQVFWVAKHGIRRTGMFSNGLGLRSRVMEISRIHQAFEQPASTGTRGVGQRQQGHQRVGSRSRNGLVVPLS